MRSVTSEAFRLRGILAPVRRICNNSTSRWVWRRRESNPPPGIHSRRLGASPSPHLIVEQDANWCRYAGNRTNPDSVRIVKRKLAVEAKQEAGAVRVTADAFKSTVRKLLETPPRPHDEMKKGGAPKRAARSSGKGAKG